MKMGEGRGGFARGSFFGEARWAQASLMFEAGELLGVAQDEFDADR
jgi:hypothetical protein